MKDLTIEDLVPCPIDDHQTMGVCQISTALTIVQTSNNNLLLNLLTDSVIFNYTINNYYIR